jgi:hypothetical protein
VADERATQYGYCPSCQQQVVIDQLWTAGGVNDYGGYVLECGKCKTVFAHRLGRDIMDSRVVSGATVLATYDDEMGNEADVMARHGLKPRTAKV